MSSQSGPKFSSGASSARYAAPMEAMAALPNAMRRQPDATPGRIAAPQAPRGGDVPVRSSGAGPQQRIPHWLVRAELFLRVMLRMYVGLAVCYAPWSHVFWDQNPVFAQFPTLAIYAANGAVRGIVSGLGLLNLWIALSDAIHHRDR